MGKRYPVTTPSTEATSNLVGALFGILLIKGVITESDMDQAAEIARQGLSPEALTEGDAELDNILKIANSLWR